MADQSDCEEALVTLIGSILYPAGSPITGFPSRIYRGYPTSSELDPDLLAGVSHVTVTEQIGFTRLTGGYLHAEVNTPGTVTMTATVSGNTVTIGGTPALGQLIGLVVDGADYAYAATSIDTPSTVATAIAALVNAGPTFGPNGLGGVDSNGTSLSHTTATVSGATTTFSSTRNITARIAAVGAVTVYNRWQLQGFRISIWAPTPDARDTISKKLDGDLSFTRWLTLPDQNGRLEWRNTYSDDCPSKEQQWRRDLYYTVQYATSSIQSATPVVVAATGINGAQFNS